MGTGRDADWGLGVKRKGNYDTKDSQEDMMVEKAESQAVVEAVEAVKRIMEMKVKAVK